VRSKLKWACVLGCAAVAFLATAKAATDIPPADANPYSVISDRNVFHLNPPPPPVSAEDSKPVELPKVALTGFFGKGKSMKVLLAIPPKNSKDPWTYLTLVPGQRDQDVELVRIHAEKEEVEILNSGTAQTLSKSNSYAAMAGVAHPTGAPAGEKEKGVAGLHHPMNAGLGGHAAGAPTAAATPGGSSPLVVGGADSRSASGGAFVSGGQSGTAAPSFGGGLGTAGAGVPGQLGGGLGNAAGNEVGAQIGNALFNSQTGHYQMPTPTTPPLPPDVQGSVIVVQKAAMGGRGPPLPPPLQAAVDGLEGQEPPPQEGPPPIPQ